MNQLLSISFSVCLLISIDRIGVCGVSGVSVTNDFGCNGYYDSTYGFWYPANLCIPDTNEVSGTSYVGSKKYACSFGNNSTLTDEDGTLSYYGYDTRDCSDYAIPIDYSSNAGSECNSGYDDDCDYVMVIQYDRDSNCSQSGNTYDVYKSFAVNVCLNITGSWEALTFYDNTDYAYVTCSQNSYNIKYYDNADCSGDHIDQDTESPYDFYDSYGDEYDYKLYCSEKAQWSKCNEDAAVSLKLINNNLPLFFIAIIIALNYSQ